MIRGNIWWNATAPSKNMFQTNQNSQFESKREEKSIIIANVFSGYSGTDGYRKNISPI